MARQGPISAVILGLVMGVLALASVAASQRRSGEVDNMHRKVLDAGSVRVIVQLRVAAVPEGQVGSADAVASQRRAIAGAQSALLAELAGTNYRVIRTYETIPFLALEVSPDALRVLEGSALVMSMEEDRLDAPQTRPGGPARDKDHPTVNPNPRLGR